MFLHDTNIGRLIMDQIETEKTASKSIKPKHIDDADKISSGLSKIASLPYNEEVYSNVQEMLKIASECISELKSSLESTSSRNSYLEKAAEVRVLIDDMLRLGLVDNHDLQEKVAELMTKTASEIDIIKEAVKLNANGSMGNTLFEKEASMSSDHSRGGMFDDLIG